MRIVQKIPSSETKYNLVYQCAMFKIQCLVALITLTDNCRGTNVIFPSANGCMFGKLIIQSVSIIIWLGNIYMLLVVSCKNALL